MRNYLSTYLAIIDSLLLHVRWNKIKCSCFVFLTDPQTLAHSSLYVLMFKECMSFCCMSSSSYEELDNITVLEKGKHLTWLVGQELLMRNTVSHFIRLQRKTAHNQV